MTTNIQDTYIYYVSGTYRIGHVATVRYIPYQSTWTPSYTINGEHPTNYLIQQWTVGIPAQWEDE